MNVWGKGCDIHLGNIFVLFDLWSVTNGLVSFFFIIIDIIYTQSTYLNPFN